VKSGLSKTDLISIGAKDVLASRVFTEGRTDVDVENAED
jgi:hypothetical protein